MTQSIIENLGYRQGKVGMDCRHTSCREYVRGWKAGRVEWKAREWALKKKLDEWSAPR
jgi:hypothetical protein